MLNKVREHFTQKVTFEHRAEANYAFVRKSTTPLPHPQRAQQVQRP